MYIRQNNSFGPMQKGQEESIAEQRIDAVKKTLDEVSGVIEPYMKDQKNDTSVYYIDKIPQRSYRGDAKDEETNIYYQPADMKKDCNMMILDKSLVRERTNEPVWRPCGIKVNEQKQQRRGQYTPWVCDIHMGVTGALLGDYQTNGNYKLLREDQYAILDGLTMVKQRQEKLNNDLTLHQKLKKDIERVSKYIDTMNNILDNLELKGDDDTIEKLERTIEQLLDELNDCTLTVTAATSQVNDLSEFYQEIINDIVQSAINEARNNGNINSASTKKNIIDENKRKLQRSGYDYSNIPYDDLYQSAMEIMNQRN